MPLPLPPKAARCRLLSLVLNWMKGEWGIQGDFWDCSELRSIFSQVLFFQNDKEISNFSGVRKSPRTCLQDQDNSDSSSIWPTSMWSLKPDLQAFSTATIGKPIFDGLPKPITGRRNKAALD
ncbi:hypothetical protein E2542_SST14036 [Spatholobus suberectus]|nr:hypothetical protein E2542_SST14036 [Spatholobus suberectus]